MSYFKILGFDKEPFSTSPDPEFFYLSREHESALTNVLVELRLKRGLSIILGDIGTGKTTLSRKLVQELKGRDDFIFNMILDPSFENEQSFLGFLARGFDIPMPNNSMLSVVELREMLEKFLFEKGITENKIVTLIIDEAQKINENTLESLRVLLNYETNEFKLLQLVLLGQMELHSVIMNIPNFFDRISFKYTLNPLCIDETMEMIDFRIKQAGYKASMKLFLEDAVREIHRHTCGYPRQLIMFCHKALKNLIMENRFVVDVELVRAMIDEEVKSGWYRKDRLLQKNSY